MQQHTIQRALLSVSDKTHLIPFARALHHLNVELLSTGGTATALIAAGLPVTPIHEYTGFPEIMSGRIKTLHTKIFGGLLARLPDDQAVLDEHHIPLIDLVVINLYPFAATIAKADTTQNDAIEQIDVGGPALLRAAAKNFQRTTVIASPNDYDHVLEEITQHGHTTLSTRLQLAQQAFQHTADYDQTISNYFIQQQSSEALPETLTLRFHKQQSLRYGENPQQNAAFYVPIHSTQPHWQQQLLQGKPVSYNNFLDADTALRCLETFKEPACVIVKHANPCGVAIGDTILHAYEKAFNTDPLSAFGGIIAVNQTLTATLAETILQQQFVEIILAPNIADNALPILATKPNIRVFATNHYHIADKWEYRSIDGGLLVQTPDSPANIDLDAMTVVSEQRPNDQALNDARFAWRVVQWVKSNGIVIARSNVTLGIGAGQTSRVQSVQVAIDKAVSAGFNCQNAVLASDAFFPFADSIAIAAKCGIRTIIQPGGSLRDEEVLASANQHGVAMLFTGKRHFRH